MTNPFFNPFYLLSPLITACILVALLVLVWKKGRRDFSNRLFCGILMSLGLWSLFTFAMRSSPDIHHAYLWNKAMIMAVLPVFALYYHFTFAYTNTKRKRWMFPAIYSFIAVLAILVATTDLIVEGMYVANYGYAPVTGPAAFFVYASLPILIAGSVYNLLKSCRMSPSREEINRLLYLTIAAVLPLFGAGLDAFSDLPPASIWGNLIFSILCTVAILKYHLLDIRIVAQKSLMYLIISGTIGIPYIGTLFFLNQIIKTKVEVWWIHATAILLFAIILRPLYSRAQQWVDRLFYRDRYDYFKALEQFSLESQSIMNLEELGFNVVQLISGALRTSNVCLLLPSGNKEGLVVASFTGLDSPPYDIMLRNDSLLVKWLNLHGDVLSSKDLDIAPQLQSLSAMEKNKLQQIRANLFVPIKARDGKLSGILILGEKLSNQTYSYEEKELLKAMSGQLSMALDNARLYHDTLRARDNLETWLNSMSDCVMIINGDQIIQFMNRSAIRQFGNKTGGNCWHALGKDSFCFNCASEDIFRNKRGGANYIITGVDRYYDVAAGSLLNPDGSFSIIEVLRDITERQQAEAEKRELEQKAQLASRLASIGEMASGIAHEINNPLTAVIGFAQLLVQRDLPKDIMEDLEIINNDAQRVAGIVNRLLTFARQHKPERKYVNINEIMANTLELRAYALKTNNIQVTTLLDSDLPGTMADGGQLQQVFLNIIINAELEMKLAHGRGNLWIRTETVDNNIRISFTDDGPGIDGENLEKIFNPFFTTREVGQGTGLGLSVCHGIMIEHGGRIYAESELGKGTTFIAELPIVGEEKTSEPAELDIDESKSVAGARILVVDDEPTVRQLLSHLLTEEGYKVEAVGNPDEVLKRLKKKRYSVILLDIKLPGMSGIELYKHIEKIDHALLDRVVFITGDVMGMETSDFLSKTSAPCITKPFDIGQVKQLINSMITQRG